MHIYYRSYKINICDYRSDYYFGLHSNKVEHLGINKGYYIVHWYIMLNSYILKLKICMLFKRVNLRNYYFDLKNSCCIR